MKFLRPDKTQRKEVKDDEFSGQSKALKRGRGGFAFTLSTYNFVIICSILVGCMYNLRVNSIFSCQANGYKPDRFVANCNAPAYGEYEHGAYWFGLEPSALNFAASADVLFLGNSRLQFAFSTAATDSWFSSASISHYLLGFAQFENAIFTKPLLRKVRPQAAVYVINVDGFFSEYESPAARTLMRDETAGLWYEVKGFWQLAHKTICMRVRLICGHQYVIFRSRKTGAYYDEDAPRFVGLTKPVSYDQKFDRSEIVEELPSAVDFLSGLPVRRECVILTMVPTVDVKNAAANALAIELGMNLIAPRLDGLQTFDGSHLDYESAERWSKAFLQEAAAQIRRCVGKPPASP
jgi:hypothetical protein